MAHARLNVATLYAALDAERTSRGMSWRQLAAAVGISPSTLTRLANDHRPDVEAFAALTKWLGAEPDAYMTYDGVEAPEEQALLTQMAPLLRARKDLTKADVAYLEEMIAATIKRFDAEKEQRER